MEHHLRQRLERLQATNNTLVASVKRKNTMITAQRRKIQQLEEDLQELRQKLGVDA